MKQIVGGKPTLKFNQPAPRLEKASLDRFTKVHQPTVWNRPTSQRNHPLPDTLSRAKNLLGFFSILKTPYFFWGSKSTQSHLLFGFHVQIVVFFFRLRLLSLGFSAIARPKRKSHPYITGSICEGLKSYVKFLLFPVKNMLMLQGSKSGVGGLLFMEVEVFELKNKTHLKRSILLPRR